MDRKIENECTVIKSEAILISRKALEKMREGYMKQAEVYDHTQVGIQMYARACAIADLLKLFE